MKTSHDIERVTGLKDCIGAISTTENTILYPESVNEQQNINTILHEVIHGVIDHYMVPIPIEDNEDVTRMLANGLFQVFRDNKGLLKIFLEDGGGTKK